MATILRERVKPENFPHEKEKGQCSRQSEE